MILQSLYEYYQRKIADHNSAIAPIGFEWREIKFVIVIDQKGNFVELEDTRDENQKGKDFLLPQSQSRTGSLAYETTFLLWDHYGYVLAKPKSGSEKDEDMAKRQNQTFVQNIRSLPDEVKRDKGVTAILSFYEQKQGALVYHHPLWTECEKISGCNLTFRLLGDLNLIPERQAVKDYHQQLTLAQFESSSNEDEDAICLITGEKGPVATIHTPTFIYGAKSNPKIVSFQKNSGYDSYGKIQALNAPISKKAEAGYTNALNYLLHSDHNKLRLSDLTLVFWSERVGNEPGDLDFESNFPWFISTPKDDPDRGVRAVKGLFEAVKTGALPVTSERFYVLALTPNASRIAVKFFIQDEVAVIGKRIHEHFRDIDITHSPNEKPYLTIYNLLSAISFDRKIDNVPPNLVEVIIRSILTGGIYPTTLLQQCMRRIRAERKVNREKAAILKAYLNRYYRIHKPQEKEISVALDTQNSNPGYRLGRLFAVLEKIQEESHPTINATIRERFFGAASTSPIAVFSQLLKLKNHHLAKLEHMGRRVFFEKLIGEIMQDLSAFPAHLVLQDQAFFSVGYYHQRQAFFAPKESAEEI